MDGVFVVIPIVMVCLMIFVFILFFSPKLSNKFFSRQIKSMRNLVDETKDDVEHISTTMAKASSEGKRIKARAITKGIKEGFSDEEIIYCKHCGEQIDADSTFCKKCGEKQ